MKTFRVCALTLLFAILVASCQGTNNSCQKAAEDAPAAMTPTGINVLAILKWGGSWTNVGKNANNEFEVLPGGLPSGGMRFVFYAPWPATIKITLDGVPIPKFDDVPAGTNPADSGYYKILNINPNPTPPIWQIGVRPPNNKLSKTMYDVTFASVSINPKYATGTPEKESAPATVKLAAQKVYTVTVFKTGAGRGTVDSSPQGLLCGTDCIYDFGQSVVVQLQASASGNSGFGSWSSNMTGCSGTGPCGFTLNGTAAVVTADFTGTATNTNMGNCKGPIAFSGFTYVGNPDCASNDIAGHPSASLACDENGYFCCELSQGSTEPRCGGGGLDHRQFPADCMAYGPKASFKDFRGCYVAD